MRLISECRPRRPDQACGADVSELRLAALRGVLCPQVLQSEPNGQENGSRRSALDVYLKGLKSRGRAIGSGARHGQ